jgi:hypothetical protein
MPPQTLEESISSDDTSTDDTDDTMSYFASLAAS